MINKEVGMVVHPGAGNPTGTLVECLALSCTETGGTCPALVWYIVLIKIPVVLLVVAKNLEAQFSFSKQLAKKPFTVFMI